MFDEIISSFTVICECIVLSELTLRYNLCYQCIDICGNFVIQLGVAALYFLLIQLYSTIRLIDYMTLIPK